MSHTYTYVYLDVSQPTYDEVRGKLEAADYGHAFHENGGHEVIDMHGLALRVDPEAVKITPTEAPHLRALCPKTLRWAAHQLHVVGFKHGIGRPVDSPLLKDINSVFAEQWNGLEQAAREEKLCWYFGTWHGPGHYFWSPRGVGESFNIKDQQPFGIPDGTHQPDNGQEEGIATLRHKDGWSILAWWDRTQDKRGGCCGALILHGEHSYDTMLQVLADRFPNIHSRFTWKQWHGKTVQEAGRR